MISPRVFSIQMGNEMSLKKSQVVHPTRTSKSKQQQSSIRRIFLGGMCGKTTWRRGLIPELEKHGLEYYNPQVDEWHEGIIAIEKEEKEKCDVLLFVIGRDTRGTASCAEAAYYIGRGRNVALVIEVYPETPETLDEARDLNRCRAYLRDFAESHAATVRVFDDVFGQALVNELAGAFWK